MTGGFLERVTMGRRMERDADAGSGVVRVIMMLLFPSWQKTWKASALHTGELPDRADLSCYIHSARLSTVRRVSW